MKKNRPVSKAKRTRRTRKEPARSSAASAVRKGRTASRSKPGARSATGRGRQGFRAGSIFNLRVFKILLVICGCLAAGAGVGAGAKSLWSWVTHSPYLSIKEVEVRTGQRVSSREVRMLADISEGDNILGFSLVDCVESIRIHPWVKEASVMRQLPDRVVIEIKERSPAAMVSLGTLYYVDEDGEIFKKVLPGDDMGYPVITGLNLRDVVEDKKDIEPLIKMSLELIELSRSSEVLPFSEVSEVHVNRVRGPTLVRTGDGMRIRFGKSDYQDKWLRMERTLQELSVEASKVAELDLNYEDRVTIGLRKGYWVASVRTPSGDGND